MKRLSPIIESGSLNQSRFRLSIDIFNNRLSLVKDCSVFVYGTRNRWKNLRENKKTTMADHHHYEAAGDL